MASARQPQVDRARRAAGRLAALSGGLAAAHRLRNEATLTVVMFHRVLPEAMIDAVAADPRYTATPAFLGDCLAFFRRHYAVVPLEHVLAARQGLRPLPPRALLVTFDDGWADTLTHATPVLRACATPAVTFVVAGAVGRQEPFWQERLYAGWRRGAVLPDTLRRLWAEASCPGPAPTFDEDGLRALVRGLTPVAPPRRAALLTGAGLGHPLAHEPQMLSAPELRELAAAGVAIGAHGMTHEPIPAVNDLHGELVASRQTLQGLLGRDVTTMSFPHGVYDEHALATAAAAGYEIMCTSDPVLNRVTPGARSPAVLGRVGIRMPEFADDRGGLRADRLALSLFRRPHAAC